MLFIVVEANVVKGNFLLACLLLDVEQSSSLEAAQIGFHKNGKFSASSSDAEDAADEEDEVLVSEVVSKYVESKCKRKSSTGIDTLRWALSPQHFLHPQKLRRKSSSSGGSKDESSSAAGIRLSRCSSATSYDEFFSVKTRFSRSSSVNRLDFQESSKHSIVLLELYHYEGWPFGLCKKAFLLPPLPKSPSDSWSWRKR